MSLKALITTLVLAATSTAALADPVVRDHRDEQPAQTQDVRDHREQPVTPYNDARDHMASEVRPSWLKQVTLPNNTYGYQVDNDGDEVVAYKQGQDPYVENIARGEWSLLGRGLKLQNGRSSEQVLKLNGRPLRSIELQATSGRSVIQRVDVQLANGREITLTPNRNLDAASAPNLRLDLGAEAQVGVRKIEIFGRSGSAGTFRVIGG